jgi:hypothetical protein
MGSVSSLNPGVANLLQTLSNVNSPVLSSPAAVSALESAPANDIVQMSMSATELENVDTLFGISNSASDGSGTNLSSLFANLESSQAAGTSAASASSTTSQAQELASYQAALRAADTQELFGTPSSGTPLQPSLFDLLG